MEFMIIIYTQEIKTNMGRKTRIVDGEYYGASIRFSSILVIQMSMFLWEK